MSSSSCFPAQVATESASGYHHTPSTVPQSGTKSDSLGLELLLTALKQFGDKNEHDPLKLERPDGQQEFAIYWEDLCQRELENLQSVSSCSDIALITEFLDPSLLPDTTTPGAGPIPYDAVSWPELTLVNTHASESNAFNLLHFDDIGFSEAIVEYKPNNPAESVESGSTMNVDEVPLPVPSAPELDEITASSMDVDSVEFPAVVSSAALDDSDPSETVFGGVVEDVFKSSGTRWSPRKTSGKSTLLFTPRTPRKPKSKGSTADVSASRKVSAVHYKVDRQREPEVCELRTTITSSGRKVRHSLRKREVARDTSPSPTDRKRQ
ncbi:hypothetical protein C8J56DRAFT_896797 [Mycena floridula]|nr:hypothetical protein C8J56DRAFT_896797 [Mycena floridula]